MKRGTYKLRTEEEARAYLHPVRMRILALLAEEPMTMTMVARELGVHPANLSYQFRKLVRAKLIELVEERDVGRVVEKYYRAVAASFEVRQAEPRMLGVGPRALDVLRADLQRAATRLPADASVLALLGHVRLSPRAAERLRARLEKLAAELRAAPDDPDGVALTFNFGVYPRAR